ncbi:hypothetical protein D3C84_581500 [compost metagenome]
MQRIHIQKQRGIAHRQHLVHKSVHPLRVRQGHVGTPVSEAPHRVVAVGLFVLVLALLELANFRALFPLAAAEQASESLSGTVPQLLNRLLFRLHLLDRFGRMQQPTTHLFRGESRKTCPLESRIEAPQLRVGGIDCLVARLRVGNQFAARRHDVFDPLLIPAPKVFTDCPWPFAERGCGCPR